MNREDFLAVQANKDTGKVFEYITRNIVEYIPLEQLPDLSKDDLTKLIIQLQPKSLKSVITYLYVVSTYDKCIGNIEAYDLVQSIDRREVWKECQKVNPVQKFITFNELNDLLYNIEVNEAFNANYYTTLLSCIYEGIYSDDLSVIKNLRRSDIKGNIVTLREDNGNSYELEISHQLAEQLIELSMIDVWQRKNGKGSFEIKIYGTEIDSCFKIEQRNTGVNYRFSYMHRIRTITQKYLDWQLRPLYLYVSGLMYRIKNNLNKEGYTLQYAFLERPKFPATKEIIQAELERCHYNKLIVNFRQMVIGFIDCFDEDEIMNK